MKQIEKEVYKKVKENNGADLTCLVEFFNETYDELDIIEGLKSLSYLGVIKEIKTLGQKTPYYMVIR